MGQGVECGEYQPPLDATCGCPWDSTQVIITFEFEEEDESEREPG